MRQLIILLFIFIIASFGILWFKYQYGKEKRSLWLGVSFLAALMGSVTFITVLLIQVSDLWFIRTLLLAEALLAALVLILFPVVFIFAMLTSGVQLIRREGYSLSHMLSLGFGIAYIAYLVIWPIFEGIPKSGFFDFIYTYLSFCFVFTLSIFALYTITNLLNLLPVGRKRYGYIIVLGGGLKDGREVTPLLARRVDKGIQAYRHNEGSILVLSGGKGGDEKIAESEAMKNYALKQGVPESDILVEDQSANTRENLLFSCELIKNHPRNTGSLLVVTTRYHVLRALLLAKNMGIPCDGRGSKTKLYFSINAFVREWIAYLVLWRKTYAAVLAAGFGAIGLGYLFGWYLGI